MRILLICILTLLLGAPASAGRDLVLGYGGSTLSIGSLRVLTVAYARIGVQVTGRPLPAARSLELANRGEVDGEVNRIKAIAKDYPGLIRIEVPINTVEGVALTCGRTLERVNVETLRSLRLGIKIGNKYAEILTRDFPDVTRMTKESKLIQLLLAGRLDALLVDRAWAREQAAGKDGACLRINEPPLTVIPLYHYLNARHADLVPTITRELQSMLDSGEIKRLLEETNLR